MTDRLLEGAMNKFLAVMIDGATEAQYHTVGDALRKLGGSGIEYDYGDGGVDVNLDLDPEDTKKVEEFQIQLNQATGDLVQKLESAF
jgi:hypothetical protein